MIDRFTAGPARHRIPTAPMNPWPAIVIAAALAAMFIISITTL